MNSVKPGPSGQREYAALPGLSELLLENFSDAVFANDVQTRVIEFWNRGAEALFGWAAEEALGKKPVALLGTLWAPGEDFESMVRTDLVMPGLNGLELAERMRLVRASIRVVFMSGYSYESVAEASVEHLPAMVSKPFTPETLAAKVREVLDRE